MPGWLLLAALVTLVGCESPLNQVRGVGEDCVDCIGGGGTYLGGGCTDWHIYACVEGSYCAPNYQTCRAFALTGEPCNANDLCASGLVCGHGGQCEAPRAQGARCTADSLCVEGTACNSGGAPEDPLAGTCEPLAAPASAPCAWSAGPLGWTGRGCAEGLTCAPLASFDAAAVGSSSNEAAATQACPAIVEQPGSDAGAGDLGACLGWPGTCAEPGLGGRGAPCTADEGCASGKCALLPPPLTGPGADPLALRSAWPGVCAGEGDPLADTLCKAGSGCELPCASHADCFPGTLCNMQWQKCFPLYQGDLGARCGQRQVLHRFADDRWCGLGLACDVDALTCRLARGGSAGAACESTEDCAGGHVCAGACAPHGQVGDPCDADRRCDFDLRCSRATNLCELPGPADSGGDCAGDAACGKGLYCEAARSTCQWLARDGEPCAPWQPCEPGLRCDPPDAATAGTCVRP